MSAAAFLVLAQIVGLTVLLTLPILLVVHWASIRRAGVAVGRRAGIAAPPPVPTPTGEPIERIAAHLRRIGRELRQAPVGLPVARRAGWQDAYDDALAAACRALDLPTELTALPHGDRRDLERLRVERMLLAAGLRIDPAA